ARLPRSELAENAGLQGAIGESDADHGTVREAASDLITQVTATPPPPRSKNWATSDQSFYIVDR
ncbi:MAG TPA: hypothetical protein PK440_11735, partial [Candidatus Accumulibacter phosphatis]|nr:hypothetical protein [Accumulibacter sp.]HRQ95648.1 hypothetical protein [Candidatus Accumulibacter phosphatis]